MGWISWETQKILKWKQGKKRSFGCRLPNNYIRIILKQNIKKQSGGIQKTIFNNSYCCSSANFLIVDSSAKNRWFFKMRSHFQVQQLLSTLIWRIRADSQVKICLMVLYDGFILGCQSKCSLCATPLNSKKWVTKYNYLFKITRHELLITPFAKLSIATY